MPEYPDIVVYIERLEDLVKGKPLEGVRFASPFLLRTARPPIDAIKGLVIRCFERMGKRIVFVFDRGYFLVLHLMVAGRLQWRPVHAKIPAKIGLASFDFPGGSLILTEAGSRKRASLHLVKGRESLSELDPGGLELFDASLDDFRDRLLVENHTLKRSLTDPRLFSGIGNAYSDEILHRAGLSPIKWTRRLTNAEIGRLYRATRETLREWTDRLRSETGDALPKKVTAFHDGMAVHGRYRKPCPVCAAPVQRIRYAANETNYCPKCQTGGKLLADRALSRLLKKDWPRSLEELEARKQRFRSE